MTNAVSVISSNLLAVASSLNTAVKLALEKELAHITDAIVF